MKEFIFVVAECCFSMTIPKEWSVAKLLPSFRPFLYKGDARPELLFQLKVNDKRRVLVTIESQLLEETTNDLGCVRVFGTDVGFHIEVSYDEEQKQIHSMEVNRQFTQAEASIIYTDETAGVALSSILRMMFAQTILRKGGISLHASCVCKEGKGYLFLGKSGTGKSTHAKQWMEAFGHCELVNDDNPILLLKEENLFVYGSPWSGKTHCYKQVHYPVGGIVRLQQALTNHFFHLSDTDAFAAMLPSCSVYRNDKDSQNLLYDIVISVVDLVPLGMLSCLPDKEAAEICFNSLDNFPIL